MNAHANVRALDPSARRRLFPTGFGKSETHAHPLREGVLNPSARAGQPYDTIDPAGIVRLLKNPPSVPKDNAQWFIPSSYYDFDARSHAAQREHGTFWWLILDVDDNDLALGEIEAALTSVVPGCRQLIYATRSSMPDGRRWRALVPLDEPVAGADYHDTADAFFDLLEEATAGALIPCRGLDRAAQLVYLPNRGEHYEHAIRKAGGSLDLTDHPISRRREETRRKRAEADAAAKAQRERRHGERAARGTGDEETRSSTSIATTRSRGCWRSMTTPKPAKASIGAVATKAAAPSRPARSRRSWTESLGFGRCRGIGKRVAIRHAVRRRLRPLCLLRVCGRSQRGHQRLCRSGWHKRIDL